MKLTPGYTNEEREKYWVEKINNARRDPRGVTAYLKSKGLNKNNYYQWFKRLRHKHPEWHDLAKDPKHRAMRERSKKAAKLPKTEVSEKAQRRRFSPQEKLRILDEFESASSGKGAAILRREGIYSSQIHQWRLERDEGSLEPKKRGPKPNPAAQEIKQLKVQLAKTEKKLAQANALIELQKKIAEILRTDQDESEETE
jgi:transposase